MVFKQSCTQRDNVNSRASRLGLPGADVKIVLESDGTEVEDDIYFQTIDKDTIFLILCPGERWLPPGVEALRAGKYNF
ncbi:UNVERIFIED_CONTAM: Cell death activator CIDE-3 [Trichonephila clavipes]